MRKGVLLTLTLCLFTATVCAVAESGEPGAWFLTVGDPVPAEGGNGETAVAIYTLSVCLTPGQGSEGATGPRGQVGAVLFTVTLPPSWQLCDVGPGGGVQGATVTVSDRAGEGIWRLLVDGPMELAGGGELAVLTVKVPSAGEASGGTVTVCPAPDSPYIYYLKENGRMTAIPLAGCTTEICPRRTQQGEEPAESYAESETGTGTETETVTGMETVPVTDIETSTEPETDPETETEPKIPSRAVYVGCQETDCGEGSFSVRFLFLVPEAGAGQGSGAVWVSGGGTATLSVSTATAVTAREGRKIAVTEPEEGYLFCMLTYSGLRTAGRYTFTVDTGQGLICIFYENGEYKGMVP